MKIPFWPIVAFLAGAARLASASSLPDLHPQIGALPLEETCKHALLAAQREVRSALDDRGHDPLMRLQRIETATGDYYDGIVDAVLLAEVSPDDKIREVASRCTQRFSDHRTDVDANPQIFALAQRADRFARSTEDRQLVKLYLEAGRRSGAKLPASARAEVMRDLKHLDALGDAFQQRLMQDRTSISIDAREASSLPPLFVATLEKSGDGYVVPVGLRTHDTFLKNEASPAARQRFDEAYFQIGMPENAARVREALALRRRIANLLGYADWDAYQLESRMLHPPQRAWDLIRDIDTRLRPRADAEIAALAALKLSSGDRSAFAAWDYAYWEEQLERTRYNVNSEEIRKYFPASKFIPAALAIYEHLLGLRFLRLPAAPSWGEGVDGYAIVDAQSGKTLAFMYLDLLPRPGKFARPSNFALRPGHRRADGSFTLPISMIYGAGPAPAPGQPALFTHHDVVEFFHEFGHVMHTTLARTPYWRLYGVGVRADFIEAPAEMFENWMWQPEVLKRISSHIDTGAAIPDELIRRLLALKHVNDGVFWTRQAFLSAFDLTAHGDRDPGNPDVLWNTLLKQWTPLPPLADAKASASFLPLFGYDASYYGYLWSRVVAQDMFSIFQRDGIDNAEVGMRYRRTILEGAGSEEPERLVERFLGRPIRADAFYRDIDSNTEPSRGADARVKQR